MAQTIPLSVPDDLLEEVRETARLTDLSVQDVFRQATKIGVVALRESAKGVPRPKRLSVWDALESGQGLDANFPAADDRVHKIEL